MMQQFRWRLHLGLCALIGLSSQLLAGEYQPMDWPHWRGPEMNGISREKGIVDRWSTKENLLWKNEEAAGRSTPIIMNGKVYLMTRDQPETKREGEKVICLDAVTGKKLWESRFNVFLSDVPDTRVGWSSVVGDPTTGRVYALGVCGYFQCLDAESGKTIWSHSLSEEYGLLSTYGGRTNFPVVHKNLVIISAVVIGWGQMAKPAHRFVAFDKRNGQPVWFEGTRLLPYDTTYSSPVLTVLSGQDAMVFGSGDGGIHAFQPQTGKNIWTYNVSRRGINTTPVVTGQRIFAGHSEENIGDTKMGALFAIDGSKNGDVTKSGEVWRVTQRFVGKSSPLFLDGRLYACTDSGSLLVVKPDNGELIQQTKLGGPMRSSPLYVDGKILLLTENGRWWTFKPSEKGVDTVYRARLRVGSSYGSPVVSHGRIYVPTTDALFCVGTADHKPETDAVQRVADPKEPNADDKPAHLQLVPVESLLRPGDRPQTQEFRVRLYNARGQWLRTLDANEVEFKIDGPGKIDKGGVYACPKENRHAAVIVTAKAGDLTGQARIRVVPELPWNIDFEDGLVPVTWVGARYRNIAIDYELYQALTAQDALTGQLYLYLMTSFTNSGRKVAAYDDSTPRLQWTGLLRFLKLLGDVKTMEQAKQKLEPALKTLQAEKFVAKWEWSEWSANERKGIKLVVTRGPRAIDGNGVMVKVKTIPKGTRSQSWMGHTYFNNYTIQADVMGARKDGKLPDIGLIGQRYTLDMMGASQQLQIRTWPPQLRMAKAVAFHWEPNVWYTIKMKTAVEDGKSVLRGKVWKRGDQEPEKWLLEAVDESPNLIGSPGLFGNAKDAEVFYDNIRVNAN